MVAHAFEVVGRELQRLEPVHEFGGEHLPLAVKRVAAHPGAFAAAKAQGADVVKLFAQLALIDEVRERYACGAVDEGEGDGRVRLVAEHRLTHQELVEIRVDQRPDDRVDLPFVIVDAGGDIHHVQSSGLMSTIGRSSISEVRARGVALV